MAICISAGSSFEGALASVGTRMDGAIAEAFARVAKEAAYSSRSEALLGLADRAQVNSITFFTASLVQAERAGSSLVDIIRMQAQSVRLALIPKNTAEVLCYEVRGKKGEGDYLVYLNAVTGRTEEILKIVVEDEGEEVV